MNIKDAILTIRSMLKNSKAIQKLFSIFRLPINSIDNLKITVDSLDKKYAETNSTEMKLDNSLFEDGWQYFVENYFFIIAHEIVHFICRTKNIPSVVDKNDAYFDDPEEILGFIVSIAYELEQKSSIDSIWNKIYGKVKWHFHDENKASEFFVALINKAKSSF